MNNAAVVLIGFVGSPALTVALAHRTGVLGQRLAFVMAIGYAIAALVSVAADFPSGYTFWGGAVCGNLATAGVYALIADRASRNQEGDAAS